MKKNFLKSTSLPAKRISQKKICWPHFSSSQVKKNYEKYKFSLNLSHCSHISSCQFISSVMKTSLFISFLADGITQLDTEGGVWLSGSLRYLPAHCMHLLRAWDALQFVGSLSRHVWRLTTVRQRLQTRARTPGQVKDKIVQRAPRVEVRMAHVTELSKSCICAIRTVSLQAYKGRRSVPIGGSASRTGRVVYRRKFVTTSLMADNNEATVMSVWARARTCDCVQNYGHVDFK